MNTPETFWLQHRGFGARAQQLLPYRYLAAVGLFDAEFVRMAAKPYPQP